MHRVIIVGSPRPDGRSASLADELFNACIDECPEDGVSIVSVASTEVAPCVGCEACAQALDEAPDAIAEGDPLEPCESIASSDAALHQCVIDDDMPEVRKHLDAADELIVVSPVYFSGAPSQLKALLDRMQPYFHSTARRGEKRPLVLHVVGEGGDPHGFEPLIGVVRSAFAVAGFELEMVLDWVGKIDENGEIVAEAEEYTVAPVGAHVAYWVDEGAGEPGCGEDAGDAEVVEAWDKELSRDDDADALIAEDAARAMVLEPAAERVEDAGAPVDDGSEGPASDEDDFEALSYVGGSPRGRAQREPGSRGERAAGRAKLSLKSTQAPGEGSSDDVGKAGGASSRGGQANRAGTGKGSANGKSQGKANASARGGSGKGASASRKRSDASGGKSVSRKQAGRASGGGGQGKPRAGKGGKPSSGGRPASGGKGGKRRG